MTSALEFELMCHFDGSQFIVHVILVAEQLKEKVSEIITAVKHSGGRPICYNRPLNQRLYKELGGRVKLPNDGLRSI
jgi:hypothetical protein